MEDFEQEIKRDFLVEAKDLLAATERCFLALEKDPDSPENINNLFRLAHNLKGSSGAVGFVDLTDFTHRLESLLLGLKEKRVALSRGIVDLLLRCNDYLTTTIEALQADLQAAYRNAELAAELDRALAGEGAPADPAPPTASAETPAEDPDFAELSQMVRESLAPPAESEPADRLPSAHAPAGETAAAGPVPAARPADENIRVSLGKIDQLLNNVGELVIFQSVMRQQSLEVAIPDVMRKSLGAMSKIVKETQSIAMGLRMLPIKQTFQKMQRIVRDASQALGKDVELELVGEETEIDKTVLERIGDPLVHIVRNAVDHGLEDAEGRAAAGKPARGRIVLSASHRAGHMIIEVRDDGRGLDADKLVKRAKEKGLLPPNATLSPDQAYALIFAPGFSTKETVTDLSGRGVGMDVVKTNITQLQGHVEIETQLGRGTCIRISLPLTLAIVDGIVVKLAAERYVVPLAQVNEFFRAKPSEIHFVHERAELLTLREETLPAFRLAQLIQRAPPKKAPAWELTALIARDSNQRAFAVLVDEVIAQQQIVIKPLGRELQGKPGMMGSAILGDGKPALILDLHELTKAQRQPRADLSAKTPNHPRTKLEAA